MPFPVIYSILEGASNKRLGQELRNLVDEAERAGVEYQREIARINGDSTLSAEGKRQRRAGVNSSLQAKLARLKTRANDAGASLVSSKHSAHRASIEELRKTFGDYGAGEVLRHRLEALDGHGILQKLAAATEADSLWEVAAMKAHALTILERRLGRGGNATDGDRFAMKELNAVVSDESNDLALRTALNIISGVGGNDDSAKANAPEWHKEERAKVTKQF